jgi:hypothetical protein
MSIASSDAKHDAPLARLNAADLAALMQSKDATIQTLEGRVAA